MRVVYAHTPAFRLKFVPSARVVPLEKPQNPDQSPRGAVQQTRHKTHFYHGAAMTRLSECMGERINMESHAVS